MLNISLDKVSYNAKPQEMETGKISRRIAGNIETFDFDNKIV